MEYNNDINNCDKDVPIIKISKEYLDNINSIIDIEGLDKYFGDWIYNVDKLQEQFLNAQPFENIIIDNFLNSEYIEKLYSQFPNDFSNWHHYNNPLEVKYAYDNIDKLPEDLKKFFYLLSSNKMIEIISKLTNIDNIEYDEYLHGAGLHAHPTNGRLNIHLDYERHPYSNKERRTNIILYLSKYWNSEWNGATELWDKDIKNSILKSDVRFNSVIIFKTNDISWHGLPSKVNCPEGVYRKSLAYYYVSPLSVDKEKYRNKATFSKTYDEPYCENMAKLYKIRADRRITGADMEKYMPRWNNKL